MFPIKLNVTVFKTFKVSRSFNEVTLQNGEAVENFQNNVKKSDKVFKKKKAR